MANNEIPSDAPPSYQQATGSSATSSSRPNPGSSASPTSPQTATSSHLEVPGSSKNGIPVEYRRSMEDEGRPLPEGWVRTFDPAQQHQFFVDTTKDPPRSTWVHPYDDDEYLSTLSSEERERLEQESFNQGKHTSKADIAAAHTDDEDDDHHASSSIPPDLPPRDGKGKGKEDTRSFGRKFKDKVTGMTHEQREEERRRRAQREQQMYEQHMRIRQAMSRAAQTGQPQFVGKDGDGKDIYIEPPMFQPPYGGYPGRGYGVDPYRGGVYTTPDARYIRPPNPYMRQRGYGYGGGYGLPLMMGGGLLGGLLIGDALF